MFIMPGSRMQGNTRSLARLAASGVINGILSASAASSALTISFQALSPLAFRDPTLTNGYNHINSFMGVAGSLVIPSGATMNVTSAKAFRLWIVGFDDGGTFRLGVVNCSDSTNIYSLNEQGVKSSTAIGGSSNSGGVIYSTVAVTSKPMRILGYLEWNSTGLTAGTWTTTNLLVAQLFMPGVLKPGERVKRVVATATNSPTNTSTSIVELDTTNYAVSITPDSAANRIIVRMFTGCKATSGAVGSRIGRVGPVVADNAPFCIGNAVVALEATDQPNIITSQKYTMQVANGSSSQTATFGNVADVTAGQTAFFATAEEVMG